MGDSFKVNVGRLRRKGQAFAGPKVLRAISNIPKSKPIAALISEAIADNFDKEGPGWAPLKGRTLRTTVGRGQLKMAQRLAAYDMGILRYSKSGKPSINYKKIRRKELFVKGDGQMGEFHAKVEKYLVRDEAQARKTGAEAGRMILQRTGLLKKAATTKGASMVNKKGIKGTNVFKVEGSTITWGVDLIYARAMNRGVEKRGIPARPFLVIRDEWMKQIRAFVQDKIQQMLMDAIKGGA